MNTHDIDIELPPLPQGEYRLSPDSRAPTLYDEEAMEAYARAAIEADRKRGGERVGYIAADLLSLYMEKCREPGVDLHIENLPVANRPPKGSDAGAVPIFLAPQPTEPADKGPWTAGVNRLDGRHFVESDDFTHDVRLYVDGDFGSDHEKRAYADGIALQLNSAEPAKDHEIAQAVNQIRDAALDFRDAGQLRARIADIVVPLIKRADRQRRGEPDVAQLVEALEEIRGLPSVRQDEAAFIAWSALAAYRKQGVKQ